jgi:hypothetical protein
MAKKVKTAKEIREEAIETARIVDDAMRSIASSLQEAFGEAGDKIDDLGKEFVKEANRGLRGLKDNAEALYDATEKARKGQYASKNIQKEIERKGKAIFLIEKQIAEAIANGATNGAELRKELAKAKGVADKFLNSLEESADKSKEINKAMGLTGAGIKGMKNIAGKLGLSGLETVFEDASDASAEMAEGLVATAAASDTTVGLGGKMRTAFEGVKVAAQGIGAALMDPLFLIGLVVKAVKFLISILDHAQKVTAKIGESLGIAGKNAKELKHQIHGAGDAGGDMYYFTDEMVDNYMELNKAAGMNLKFNEKNAKMFQDMTHYMGLSVEQAAGLFKISAETNVPFAGIYDNIVNTVNELDAATGFSSDMGSIIDGMVNASSSVRYNIKGGAEGLAKAAHTANRLGLSMDEIAAAAESHLDFESSIAKEIEAEMYLQKDLNLDKLRYAALTGDTALAAKEEERLIKENMKSLKGNVLAQQAFADATGISRDRLNDVMANQERIKKLTPQQLKDEKAKSAEMAKQGKISQTFDRSMQSAVIQLKAALLPIAEKLGPVLIKGAEFIGNFVGSPAGKTLLAVAGLVATGVIIGKIGSSIMNLFSGGIFKMGSFANPMYTYNLNESGGGGSMDNIGRFLKGNVFKYLGKKGGLSRTLNRSMIRTFGKNGFTKFFQTKVFTPSSLKKTADGYKVVNRGTTMLGRGLNNLFGKIIPSSGANLEKAFGTNQMNKIQKMSQTGRNAAGQFISKAQQAKAGSMVSKFTRPGANMISNLTSKATNLLPKGLTATLSKAGPVLSKTLKVLGPVGVALDAGIGGFTGYSQAQMSAEEQKASGVKEDISTGEAIAQGILTGGAEKGSMMSSWVGIEKGGGADEAMGVGGSALRGAGIGATIGTMILPGVGTAIGAGIGGIVGGVSETFKLLTNPDSQLRKNLSAVGDSIGEFASNAGETISGWASSAGETLSGWASSAGETIGDWTSSAGEGISSFVSSAYDGVSSLASGAADLASEAGSYVADTFSSVGSSIANSSVGQGVGAAVDYVADSWINPSNWFAEGGIVTKPMIGGIGEAGPEAIIPLSQAGDMLGGNGEVTKLLKELISEVRKGGNVYLDGSKVGYALALQSSKMG